MVIDINGYYASPDGSNLVDFVSIVGGYAFGGGVLYVENKSDSGAAISAQGTDARGFQAVSDRPPHRAHGTACGREPPYIKPL